MSETSDFSTRHNLHGLIAGAGIYYFLNKQGNKNAMLYGVGTGGFLFYYMRQWGHNAPDFSGGLTDLNKGLANIFGG